MSVTSVDRRDIQSNEAAFNAWAHVYDKQANPLLALEERFLDCLLPIIDDKDVLDAGCGTGRWLERFMRRGSPRSLCGVDSSEEMLEVATRKQLKGVSLYQASIHHLPIDSASIDIALASFVMSYVPDIHRSAKELARVLRDRGELILADMHPNTAIELGWRRGFHSSQGEVSLDNQRHSIESIVTAIEDHGLQLAACYQPQFGEAEQSIFISAGKEAEYRKASDRPAIYILHFTRTSTKHVQPNILLSTADCVLGGSAIVNADVAIQGGLVSTITSAGSFDHTCDEISLTGYTVFPGLINAHDHLEFSLFPRLGNPPYRNATEWALDIQQRFKNEIERYKSVPKEVRLWWGALRNLLSGVTTACHHNPAYPLFEDPRFPINVVKDFGWEHSLSFANDLYSAHRQSDSSTPFILHACEGIDSTAASEFEQLEQLALIDDRTVVVHGLAMTAANSATLNRRGGSLITCPTSNYFLFSQHPSLQQLCFIDRLAIGSDSPLTAAGDLLDEIRFCREHIGLSPGLIYRSVTFQSARVLQLKHNEGRLAPTSPANLFAVRSTADNPDQHLTRLNWRDVELVITKGIVRVASAEIWKRLPPAIRQNLTCIFIDGIPRWVDAPVKDLFQSAATVFGINNVFLNGRSVSLIEE